jgi:uncharacterized membrane protein
MAFCGKCGTEVQAEVKFCPSCGGAMGAETAAGAEGKDAEHNKVMGVVAYLLFFVPLLAGAHKTSPFVKFHTNQGTVLAIASVVWQIVSSVIRAILYAIHWRLGYYLGGLLGWVSVAFLALCVIGIMNAVNGKQSPLPVIGNIHILK